MSDAAEPVAPGPETTAPRTMPQGTPPTPPEGDGGADYNPAQDTAAAIATLRAAKAPSADAPPADAGQVVAAAVADATGTPAPPAAEHTTPVVDPADAKLDRIFTRIAALEKERDEARGSLSRLEAEAATGREAREKLERLRKSPKELIKELGWNQDTLADYVLKGDDAVSPQLTAFEQQQADLKREIEQLRHERAQEQQARKIEEFKGTIPAQLKDAKASLPHVSSYFDSEREMADAVWRVMATAYQQQKTELTVLEAAKAVENVLSEQAKRFTRASSQSPASSNPASAPKPPAPTLTNRATTTPTTSVVESDETSPNFKAAAELLRSFRKQ